MFFKVSSGRFSWLNYMIFFKAFFKISLMFLCGSILFALPVSSKAFAADVQGQWVPSGTPGVELFKVAQASFVQGEASNSYEPPKAEEVTPQLDSDKKPVDLQADTLSHDSKNKIITASGSVVLQQDGRTLRANEVIYDMSDDRVVARGSVELLEANGDVHYADVVELQDRMKNGVVEHLRSELADGAYFTALEGERSGGQRTVMQSATYTPCEPCEEDPDKAPIWQIRAAEVSHDTEGKNISYKHARFEFAGIPLLYTPYFSHPDGSVDRKSGLLAPSIGYNSSLGAFMENSYYWAIAPDKDMTFSLLAMTKEDPLVGAAYRQRWANAEIEFSGGITNSRRVEKEDGEDLKTGDDVRGHVFVEGEWDINSKWRATTDINWASDDQYMDQYDLTNDDVLRSEIELERFSGRNYAVARLLALQDTRVGDLQADQPEVLPEIVINMQGEPNSMPMLGGSWMAGGSFLGLRRASDGQDMGRLSLDLGWKRRMVSESGFVVNALGTARSDFYQVSDRDVANVTVGRSRETTEARIFPQFDVSVAYPLVKNYRTFQALISPEASITVSSNIDDSEDIPNEDSRDVQIDATNLFDPNRFPGLDRVEDRSHVTYGLRSGIYGNNGSYTDIFLGQSYRLKDDDNPFPVGSGLDDQSSDIVGQLSSSLSSLYDLNYRFQLDSNDLSAQRHEVDARFGTERFSLGSRYLFAKALAGTEITESREQVQADASYYLNTDWRTKTGGTYDLGDNEGWRKAFLELNYLGQCLSWSLRGQKNYTDDASGESDTEVLFRIGLKNLGSFQKSALRNRSEDE